VTLFGIAAVILLIITIIFFLFLISITSSTVLDFDAPHFQVVFFKQRTHAPEQATLCWWGLLLLLWMFFVILHE
jgi:hypothetical protein